MSKEIICIDREVEREVFEKMLQFNNDARLLTIKDIGGRGKSSLLKKLRYECYRIKDIPVSLISLDNNSKIPSEFDLVKAIREDLKNFKYLMFTKFDILDNARMLKNPTPFTDFLRDNSGLVNAEYAEIKDQAIVAAQIDTVIQKVKKIILNPRDNWPSEDYEAFVRQYCIAAFFEDLKVICKEKPLVILLDAWEKCGETLQDWIIRPMLHEHCFDVSERPAKLIFVLAGRDIPPFKERLQDRYSSLIVNRDKLSEWSFEHMKEFLDVHGYKDKGLSDAIVEDLRQKVNTDKSLNWALGVVGAYFK